MKTQDTIESDVLIAEFMGYEKAPVAISKYNGRGYEHNIVDGYTIPGKSYINNSLSVKECFDWGILHLQFTNNWDWLMPVVERIESLKIFIEKFGMCYLRVSIVDTECNLHVTKIPLSTESIFDMVSPVAFHSFNETKIKATYTSVVDFITWYNKYLSELPKPITLPDSVKTYKPSEEQINNLKKTEIENQKGFSSFLKRVRQSFLNTQGDEQL